MTKSSFIFACVAVVALALGGCTSRERGPGHGGGTGTDAGGGGTTDGGGDTDGSMASADGGGSTTDGGGTTTTDGGGGGGGEQGTCDPTCLEASGAYCCTTCGCSGSGPRCDPRCDAPYEWDCEIGCCFDYDTFECACPTGTSWDADKYCCTDTGGTCVVPAG